MVKFKLKNIVNEKEKREENLLKYLNLILQILIDFLYFEFN